MVDKKNILPNTEGSKIINISIGAFYVIETIDEIRSVEFRSSRLGPCLLDDGDVCVPQSYKKDKNRDLISFAIFLTDQYYFKLALANQNKIVTLSENKIKTMNVLNDYATYNLNLNAVIESISNKPYHV